MKDTHALSDLKLLKIYRQMLQLVYVIEEETNISKDLVKHHIHVWLNGQSERLIVGAAKIFFNCLFKRIVELDLATDNSTGLLTNLCGL